MVILSLTKTKYMGGDDQCVDTRYVSSHYKERERRLH